MNKGQENQVEKKEQKKRIAANTLYTMGGLIFMNGVLQLIITPLLNRYMGAKQLGELLYIMSPSKPILLICNRYSSFVRIR